MTTHDLFNTTNLNRESRFEAALRKMELIWQRALRQRSHTKALRQLSEYPDYLLQDIGLNKGDFSSHAKDYNQWR